MKMLDYEKINASKKLIFLFVHQYFLHTCTLKSCKCEKVQKKSDAPRIQRKDNRQMKNKTNLNSMKSIGIITDMDHIKS
jgi:hypothetical protein